jgi:polysaccharide chain length determinant protein (PEP-CTERM system associated)
LGQLPSVIRLYLRAIWRRKWTAALFCWGVCVTGWAVVALVPNQYESQARVFADVNTLLTPLLSGLAVNTDPDRQLGYMERTLLSRSNLEQIAHLANMGPPESDEVATNEFLNRLAHDITIRLQSANLFLIAYENPDPVVAKNVVQGALTVFAENTVGNNREQMDSARQFLDQQIARYEQALRSAEAKRAAFREKYAIVLPDIDATGSKLDTARAALQNARAAVADATARRDAIRKELTSIPSTTALEQAYPLAAGTNDRAQTASLLNQARQRLSNLLLRYTEAYPDVVTTRREITELENQLAGEKGNPARGGGIGMRRSTVPNVVFEQIKIKLADAESSLAAANRQLIDAENNQKRIETALHAAPGVELQAQNLDRDYGVLKKNYEELITRREAADIAEAANVQADKVQFRIIDPPQVAAQPVEPNRVALDSGVLIVGLVAGIGIALLLAQLDRSFATLPSVRELGLPVLGSVSLVRLVGTRRAAFRHAAGVAIAALALFLVYGALLVKATGNWKGLA